MSAGEQLANDLLVETVERLLTATCTFEEVARSEETRWATPVWDALAEVGFPWVSIPEVSGGSGGSVFDAAAILRSVGAHSAPLPLAETGLLGGWLLSSAGLTIPEGPLTVVSHPAALSTADGRLTGEAVVAWAERSSRIVTLVTDGDSWKVASVRPSQVTITPGANMAGEPRDTVIFNVALDELETAPAPEGVNSDALLRRGSLSRILLSAGSLEAMTQLTVDYTSIRRQFGKPIASFQAVQQHLITAAQCSVKASMAADLATRAVARGDNNDFENNDFELAAARVVVDQAAVLATRAAHQAHGAMGVTREYPLHHHSRRLWAWRHEYQRSELWKQQVGQMVHARGANGLFPLITTTPSLNARIF